MKVKVTLLEPGTMFVQSSRHGTKTVTETVKSAVRRILRQHASVTLDIDPNELLVLKPQGAKTPDGQLIREGQSSPLVNVPLEGRNPAREIGAQVIQDNFLGESHD